MFGHYYRKLDEKGRVMIPPKHREALGEVFYLTIGLDNVMELRDSQTFSKWRDKLLSANTLNPNARNFARMLLGRTMELQVDKQGRIKIPEEFAKSVSLTKEVAFVGVGNKIELWSQKAYEDFQKQFEEEGSLDDLAKKLLKDGVEL